MSLPLNDVLKNPENLYMLSYMSKKDFAIGCDQLKDVEIGKLSKIIGVGPM